MTMKTLLERINYEFHETPETGYTCPVCGVDVEWWKEPYAMDENGCVCHEICLRDTEDEQWETV